MKLKQTVITEKKLKKRWLDAEDHLEKVHKGYVCKHGIDHGDHMGQAYCRKCLKESVS